MATRSRSRSPESGRRGPAGRQPAGGDRTGRGGKPSGGWRGGEPLQRFLARCGVAARRKAEELIRQGRVTLNGRPVRGPGVRVHPERDRVCLDGRPLRPERPTYVLLHKPEGFLAAARDPRGRRTVFDLVREAGVRLHPVGRLDWDSSGLLLLTNDGELTNRLIHPRYHLERTYRVLVAGRPAEEALAALRRGVLLSDGPTLPARVRVLGRAGTDTWLEVALAEGRNRQVRRMLAAVGHDVKKLVRTRLGPLALGDLPLGAWRHLTPAELASLRAAAGLAPAPTRRARSAPSHRGRRPVPGLGSRRAVPGGPPGSARGAAGPRSSPTDRQR